MTKISFFT